ncbi:methyltransferase domain-containing protein [Desulfovibrio aerotolerans]|uniref:Methyltransferase domain-containing protein n=1 Tax=Solidesulfovibrio aerotolerans TaxID=295255 RepID=A0A7C9NKE9_9BACT|nr:class I SAM-dependent methyltransferase [Solidesulfovibrio aerotolerans]MYL83996.1 methyltransferase domain-containing protein [Solidesulfovibrio aerotolerans]
MAAQPQDDVCRRYEGIADWFVATRFAGDPPMEQAYLTAVRAELPPGAAVLDLGCGTGEPLAGFFIRAGHPVVGIDGSPAMIAKCRERFPDMTWIVGDMRRLALGRTFGAVLAWDSFFHLTYDDQRAMFAVFAAHTAAGGLLLFTSGPDHGEANGVMDGVPFAHYSLAAAEYRSLLLRHGFAVLRHVVNDPACGGHTIWLARKKPAAPAPRTSLSA